MSFNPNWKMYFDRNNTFLEKILRTTAPNDNSLFHQAMRYAVLSGGKRIRPLLVYLIGDMLGVPVENLDAPAAAIELIHCYSLVHDDLPSMDNDDLRRGLPTCHKQFGEATAILVGDALQTLAFEVLSRNIYFSDTMKPHCQLAMIHSLARACGAEGMAGGQALDLAATSHILSQDALDKLHLLKTGALIQACCELAYHASTGTIADRENNDVHLTALNRFGRALGLAFQIHDDILDVEASTAVLGKPQGSDREKQKFTYLSLMSLEEAKSRREALHKEAFNELNIFGEKAHHLKELGQYVLTRGY